MNQDHAPAQSSVIIRGVELQSLFHLDERFVNETDVIINTGQFLMRVTQHCFSEIFLYRTAVNREAADKFFNCFFVLEIFW